MITEDYVSFETAKLLKEKGFDEPYKVWYTEYTSVWGGDSLGDRKYIKIQFDDKNRFDESYKFLCYAPTLQMAMKWLREVHNLCIEPYRTACGYLYTISTIPYGSCKCNPKEGGDDEDSGQWTTYEGACEAAIKYCLENLI